MLMMKISSEEGRKTVVLGLSDGNLSRLREGKPIHIFGAQLGIAQDIIIFWGETEEKMAAEVTERYGREPSRNVKQ